MKTCSLFLLVLWSSLSVILAEEAPLVSKLGEGDSMVVEYSTRGCFHSSDHIIVLTSKSATITSVVYVRKPDGKKEEKARALVGELVLSKQDIKKLDALFEFYAKGPDGGCTTVDEIKVTMMKGEKEIKAYEFKDGSCSTYDMKSVLTFGELLQRLRRD